MFHKRWGFGITYDSESKYIFVFGGRDGYEYHNELKLCEKYSVENNKWIVISPMARRKSMVSACTVDNKFIYIIGGYDSQYKTINDIAKYDINND